MPFFRLTQKAVRVPARYFSIIEHAAEPISDVDIESWSSTISSKASTAEGKNLSLQLSSLINFYNREFQENEKSKINWDEWKSKIQTKGLVDKIQANTEELLEKSYNTEPIMEKVKNSVSEHEDSINKELHFHTALWSTFYLDQLDQHISLKFIPRMNDLSKMEKMDYFPAELLEKNSQWETMNFQPNTFQDTDMTNWTFSQFVWGKRLQSFYSHPVDDFRSDKATVNQLGA